MIFQRLKLFLPRNLYGRAFLILLVPIVIIQVVVSYVYINRHFEGVTHQMVDNVTFEINYILKMAEGEGAKDLDHPEEVSAEVKGEPEVTGVESDLWEHREGERTSSEHSISI